MNNYISEELENLEILADKMTDEANDLAEMANNLFRAAGFEDVLTQSLIFRICEATSRVTEGLLGLNICISSLKEK